MSLLILFGGSNVRIADVEVLAKDLIRIKFFDEMVVDDDYYNPETYTLVLEEGSGPSRVVEVLELKDDSKTALDVLLRVQNLTDGSRYRVFVGGDEGALTTRGGASYADKVGGAMQVYHTKLDALRRSVPKHYDTRPGSNLGGVLTAISLIDNEIGGGRRDDIEVARVFGG